MEGEGATIVCEERYKDVEGETIVCEERYMKDEISDFEKGDIEGEGETIVCEKAIVCERNDLEAEGEGLNLYFWVQTYG
jgi:hypothetical protein